MLNQAFTEKSTKAAGKIAERHIERWDELLLEGSDMDRNDGWTETRNMAEWTGNLMFDIMGDMAFGKQFDVKETGFESEFKSIPGFAESFMGFMYPVREFFTPLLGTVMADSENRLYDLPSSTSSSGSNRAA